MTCSECATKEARIIELERELKGYRSIVDGSEDRAIIRRLSALLGTRPKATQLVYRLWKSAGRYVDADVLSRELWPEGKGGQSSVRTCVWAVRDALGNDAVLTQYGGYKLNNDWALQVDTYMSQLKEREI